MGRSRLDRPRPHWYAQVNALLELRRCRGLRRGGPERSAARSRPGPAALPARYAGRSAIAGAGFRRWIPEPRGHVTHRATRIRGTAVALNTGTDRGVERSAGRRRPSRFRSDITVGFSAVHAAINGIGRTVNDPQPIGRDIPYSTFVLSLSGARRSLEACHVGRRRSIPNGRNPTARADQTFGLDGGLLVDRVFGYDARVGRRASCGAPAPATARTPRSTGRSTRG